MGNFMWSVLKWSMFAALYIPTRFAGVFAYLISAPLIVISILSPFIIIEYLILGAAPISWSIIFLLTLILLGYLFLYDHSPTSDVGLGRDLKSFLERTTAPSTSAISAGVEGAKYGMQESKKTKQVFEGIGTVAHAYMALYSTIKQSVENEKFIIDWRIRENIFLFQSVRSKDIHSPEEAVKIIPFLSYPDELTRVGALESIVKTVEESGAKSIVEQYNGSIEDILDPIVVILTGEDEYGRSLSGMALADFAKDYPEEINKYENNFNHALESGILSSSVITSINLIRNSEVDIDKLENKIESVETLTPAEVSCLVPYLKSPNSKLRANTGAVIYDTSQTSSIEKIVDEYHGTENEIMEDLIKMVKNADEDNQIAGSMALFEFAQAYPNKSSQYVEELVEAINYNVTDESAIDNTYNIIDSIVSKNGDKEQLVEKLPEPERISQKNKTANTI